MFPNFQIFKFFKIFKILNFSKIISLISILVQFDWSAKSRDLIKSTELKQFQLDTKNWTLK